MNSVWLGNGDRSFQVTVGSAVDKRLRSEGFTEVEAPEAEEPEQQENPKRSRRKKADGQGDQNGDDQDDEGNE